MGAQLQLLGNHTLPFCIMLAVVHYLDPVAFFHECTRNFRHQLLGKALPRHKVHHRELNPPDFGQPLNRRRSYSSVIREDYVLENSLDDMHKFFISCNVDAGALFVATDAEAS
jgi:hypothetical protein